MSFDGTAGPGGNSSVVPRFYFHIFNDIIAPDEEGVELPDAAAAHLHATHSARTLVGMLVMEGVTIKLHHRIDVADAGGSVITTVRFGDVLKIDP
jgi:hypothetical protein